MRPKPAPITCSVIAPVCRVRVEYSRLETLPFVSRTLLKNEAVISDKRARRTHSRRRFPCTGLECVSRPLTPSPRFRVGNDCYFVRIRASNRLSATTAVPSPEAYPKPATNSFIETTCPISRLLITLDTSRTFCRRVCTHCGTYCSMVEADGGGMYFQKGEDGGGIARWRWHVFSTRRL